MHGDQRAAPVRRPGGPDALGITVPTTHTAWSTPIALKHLPHQPRHVGVAPSIFSPTRRTRLQEQPTFHTVCTDAHISLTKFACFDQNQNSPAHLTHRALPHSLAFCLSVHRLLTCHPHRHPRPHHGPHRRPRLRPRLRLLHRSRPCALPPAADRTRPRRCRAALTNTRPSMRAGRPSHRSTRTRLWAASSSRARAFYLVGAKSKRAEDDEEDDCRSLSATLHATRPSGRRRLLVSTAPVHGEPRARTWRVCDSWRAVRCVCGRPGPVGCRSGARGSRPRRTVWARASALRLSLPSSLTPYDARKPE